VSLGDAVELSRQPADITKLHHLMVARP
jgi:hypothetical protein